MENTFKNKLKKSTDVILDLLPNNIKDTLLGIKRFNFFKRQYPSKQLFIQLVDGRETHGGLADRIKGMVSAYCLAKSKGLEFRIKHTFPFELQHYLQPNKIDWRLKPEDRFSNNIFESHIMHITHFDDGIYRLSKTDTSKQIHAYSRGDILEAINTEFHTNYDWGTVYNILFKPSDKLQKEIDIHLNEIGGKYITVVFRFQNLLGDFPEYSYPTLEKEEQINLINHCKTALLDLQKNISTKILVTSDSLQFTKAIANMNNIVTFPQKIVHMDFITNENFEVYLKSFLDFYLIANSTKVYSIGTSIMYKTNFPKYAAKVKGIPFERIEI